MTTAPPETPLDAFLTTVDAALRTLFVTPHASQPCPTLPEQATEQHLQILSELAQMFSDRAFREQLAAAADEAAVHALFTGWESHASGERRAAV